MSAGRSSSAEMPACCKSAKRRGDAEARTSFGRQVSLVDVLLLVDVSLVDVSRVALSRLAFSSRDVSGRDASLADAV